jgi:hypothetical protein
MATAAQKLAPFDHSMESDKDAQVKTVFKLRPLNSIEYIKASDMHMLGRGECFNFVLSTALLGWVNFTDAQGVDIKFSRKAFENIERLTVDQITELANKVLEASNLDETERKN